MPSDSRPQSVGWLYPADSVQGRADRSLVDPSQRHLSEFEQVPPEEYAREKLQRLDAVHADLPDSDTADAGRW